MQSTWIDRPKQAGLGIVLGLTGLITGCSYTPDLEELDGTTLGVPASAAYGFSTTNDVMVVFSDLPDLCTRLKSAAPPSDDFWVVSAWDGAPRGGAGAFGNIQRSQTTQQYSATLKELKVTKFMNDGGYKPYVEGSTPTEGIRGSLEIRFDTGDEVSTRFEASYCDAGLFNTLQ